MVADGNIQRFEQGPYAPQPAPPSGLGGAPLPVCSPNSPRAVLTTSGCLRGPSLALPMTPAWGLQRSCHLVPAAATGWLLQQPGDWGLWVPAASTSLQL